MFKENEDLVINTETKIGELLDAYPFLEDKLIEIAPVFSKLQNPFLRKTIAKVTSIKQAAAVGNVELSKLINTLRGAVGQSSIEGNEARMFVEYRVNETITPDFIFDARKDLENGNPPIQKLLNDLKNIGDNQIYLVITPFYPAPMIAKAKEKGFTAKIYQVNAEEYETYFQKEKNEN